MWVRCVYVGVSHASHPKRAEFQGSQFWGSPIFLPTLCNAKRPKTAWYHIWGGRVYGTSATPMHLYKCVARFVSDSRVFFVMGCTTISCLANIQTAISCVFFTLCYIDLQYDCNNNNNIFSLSSPITFWTTWTYTVESVVWLERRFHRVSVSPQRFNSVFWLLI